MTPAEIARDVQIVDRDDLLDFISDLITPARTVGWILTGTTPVYVLWIDGTFGILDERALSKPEGSQSLVLLAGYSVWKRVADAYRHEGQEAATQLAHAALGTLSTLAMVRNGYPELTPILRNESAAVA